MKLCALCGEDCSHGGEFVMAWEIIRGPGPFQFKARLVSPPEAICGEAVCRPCTWDDPRS